MSFTVSESVLIDQPRSEVWRYVTTEEEWRRPVVRDVQALDDGPLRVGSRYRNEVVAGGIRTHPVYEMTVVEPPARLAWTQIDGGGPVWVEEGNYLLEDLGENRTRFTLHNTYRPTGIGKIVVPVLRLFVRSNVRRAVSQLEDLVAPR